MALKVCHPLCLQQNLGTIHKRRLTNFCDFQPPLSPPVSQVKYKKSPQITIFPTPLPPPQRRRLLWMVPNEKPIFIPILMDHRF